MIPVLIQISIGGYLKKKKKSLEKKLKQPQIQVKVYQTQGKTDRFEKSSKSLLKFWKYICKLFKNV